MHDQHTTDDAVHRAIQTLMTQTGVGEDEAKASLMEAVDAVPREHLENALSVANLAGMGREKAEAEASRLRDAILAHRDAMLAENGLGAGVEPDKADLELWHHVPHLYEEGR